MSETDELDDLFVDENEPIDRKLVASIIKPFVNSIGKNKVIDFGDAYDKLDNPHKILVVLVCRKAMFLKGIIDSEAAGPREIAENAGISESAAKKIALNENIKKFCSSEDGKYHIPNHKLKRVKQEILGNG